MTKSLAAGVAILFMAFVLVYVVVTPDIDLLNMKKDWGTKKMYVRVTEPGQQLLAQERKGTKDSRYHYYLVAYDAAGNARPISFSTPKSLKTNAVLLVLVKGAKDRNGNHLIGRYDVVELDKVPVRIREKLELAG
ncbi:DUF1093 domain-containing protein [Paenibacillus aquistagni]|uniref:DUF1093 domain-containing protein n=1 Tax=Paenibacillus aquistagni TaxID=1852522 RepID=UPI00145B7622|nr:YxeA family protein [Paenibacillus aquistagni]NMM53615.1 YxeA family protein [Paenibacillus aquistagni]